MSNAATAIENLRMHELFKPGNTGAWEFLSRFDFLWEALPKIGEFIEELAESLDKSEYEQIGSAAWAHRTASIAATAHIGSGIIIGAETEVRHCAYLRGPALIGKGAVVGNSTELKNVILFDGVQVPHFNYVGDSILGHKAHMGAGSITSNVKSDSSLVSVIFGAERIETGLKKFGAILGDSVEIGCNSVLNPGAIIGAESTIYPLSSVRGYIPPRSIYKRESEIVEKMLRE